MTTKNGRRIIRLASFWLGTLTLAATILPIVGLSQSKQSEQLDADHQQALMALRDLASEAKGFTDSALKVRVNTQIADALWPYDSDSARSMLLSAFEDVTGPGIDVAKGGFELRSQVIRTAYRHDQKLASELMAKVKSDKDHPGSENVSTQAAESISQTGLLNLDLAWQALRTGDQTSAVSYAKQSLDQGRSPQLLLVLAMLRQKDTGAADQLFLSAVSSVLGSSNDPTDVLFLGQALFTPASMSVLMFGKHILPAGGVNFAAATTPSQDLLMPYLRASAALLARALADPNAAAASGAAITGRYALMQLMPLFDRFLPDTAQGMHALLQRLGAAPSNFPTPHDDSLESDDGSPFPGADEPVPQAISDISATTGDSKRDDLFFKAATRSLNGEHFDDAREFASHISDGDYRQGLGELIDYKDAMSAIEKGDLGRAEVLAGHLTEDRPSLVYYKLASQWFERKEPSRAQIFVDQAASKAAKISDPASRAKVYANLAMGLAKFDPVRSFEFAEAAVKAANSADNFKVSSGSLTFEIKKGGETRETYSFASGILLTTLAAELAKHDLFRTLELARSLQPVGSRALMVISACKSVLASEEKKAEPQQEPKPGKKETAKTDA